MKKGIEDTIAAVSTPAGEGGIGIVRLSGADSVKIADAIFISRDKRRPSGFKSHTIHYGHIIERAQVDRSTRAQVKGKAKKSKNNIVDEVLLTVMRAPRTYTKEDIVEINCHGGAVALKKVLELTVRNGARIAEPGEFTKRAFLSGRIDLTQAEAVVDIIRAKTDAGLRASLNQLEGGLSGEIKPIRNSIIEVSADVEAAIDFPAEDIEIENAGAWLEKLREARKRLEKLADTYHDGAILREGVTAVICGRANVGKSSLMNLLLKRDRVIVTHIPGTTRDAIEELVNIKGLPVKLVDTAGMKKQRNVIEKAGIEKTRRYLSSADLMLCVLDGSERLKKDDIELLKIIDKRCGIILVNKCDLRLVLDIKEVRRIAKKKDIIKISCLKREGIDRLEKSLYNKIWSGKAESSHQAMLNNLRHKYAIDRAVESLLKAEDAVRKRFSPELLSVDIKEGISALGEIVGQIYTDDILDLIFSKFCIGK